MKTPGIFRELGQRLRAAGSIMRNGPQAAMGPEELIKEMASSRRSTAGPVINSESAMRVGAVFACMSVISEDLSSLPLGIFKKLSPRGRTSMHDLPVHRVLHDQANEWQTAMEFREQLQGYALLRGKGHALISRVRGAIDELLPIHPDHIQELKTPSGLYYEVQPEKGGPVVTYAAKDIFCLVGKAGGRGVLQVARDSIGEAAAQQEHASENFRDGGLTRISLEHPANISEGAAKRLRESWVEIYGGKGSHAKPAVLEEGMKANKIGLTAAEMQFLDGREFSVEDIARFFRVSPHKIGHLKRATNNNIEELSIDHVTSTLRPWAVRWEQRIKMSLLTAPGERDLFAKHTFDGLLRGDTAKRHAAYAIGRQWGWWSANDVREKEDENPIEGGDVYLLPVNMQDAKNPLPAPEPGSAKGGLGGDPSNA